MTEHIGFHTLFLLQILLVSFYLPARVSSRLRWIFSTYPPSLYPKLYPKPIDHYERGQRIFRFLNGIIFVAGISILAALLINTHDGDLDNAIVIGYFLAQMVPMALLDAWSIKEFASMRSLDSRIIRKAQLRPRRLFEIVSLTAVIATAIVYIVFVTLGIYVEQLDFPGSNDGYWNIFTVTAANIFFAGLFLWTMSGKKMNPHEAHEDRIRRIRATANILMAVSVGATLFIALSVALSAFDVRHLLPVALSAYFQFLALFVFKAYLLDIKNFDVYKKDTAAAS